MTDNVGCTEAARNRHRMALGAQPADVAQLIGRQTLMMTASGVLAGLSAGLFGSHAIRVLLYDISRQAPVSLISAILFVAVTAGLATVFPVLDATKTEPVNTLRAET